MRCAKKIGRAGQVRISAGELGQTEIADVGPVLLIKQYVAGFEVAVKHSSLVRELHRLCEHARQLGDLAPFSGESRLPLGESAADGELHGEEGHSIMLAHLINRQNRWVLQFGKRSHLQPEALGHLR